MKKIEWKDLILLSLSNDDLSQLFEWRNSPSFLNFLTARPKSESLEDFKLEIKRDFSIDRHLQYAISYRDMLIGTIYSYSYNRLDKYCFISVFVKDDFRNFGFGVKAVAIFSKFLFEQFNLFKIYFDIYDLNYQLISALKKRKISIEGQFIKQHVYKGKRFDVFRFAIYADDIFNWFNLSTD
jgi:RimJ/RimL family protein N-acetyltransferase